LAAGLDTVAKRKIPIIAPKVRNIHVRRASVVICSMERVKVAFLKYVDAFVLNN
jgi:hypothetical protein